MGLVRLTLAISVAIWHIGGDAPFRLLNAAIAVLAFFIVSGFYMAMVISEKYAPAGGHWARNFYWHRFLRLAPAYYFFLLFSIWWFVATHNPAGFWNVDAPWPQRLMLAMLNFGVVGQDVFQLVCTSASQHTATLLVNGVRKIAGPAMLDCSQMIIGQAWSLGSEIVFYAMAPFVVRSPLRIAALLVASLAVRIGVVALGLRSGIWDYWFLPATLCMFMAGALSYHAWRRFKPPPALGWPVLVAIAIWFATTAWQNGVVLPSPPNWAIDQPQHWIALILFAVAVPPIFAATRDLRLDRRIGELSYPFYLCHGLIIGAYFDRTHASHSDPRAVLAILALSAAGAWAIQLIAERPFQRPRGATPLAIR